MLIKFNYFELIDKIKDAVIEASTWGRRSSGEIQLYAEYDQKTGHVYNYYTTPVIGHSTWSEGEGLVFVYSHDWFDAMEDEDLSEWLKEELELDEDLEDEFRRRLIEEYGEEEFDDPTGYALYTRVDDFREFFPEKWEELYKSWEETALEWHLDNTVDYNAIIYNLEREGVDISTKNPTTSEVLKMEAATE